MASICRKSPQNLDILTNLSFEFLAWSFVAPAANGLLSFNIIKTISNINDIIQVNDNGVLQLDAMYEKFAEDYKKRTGEELNMSKEDFMDLIRTNLRNQVKELTILLAMVGLMLSVGYMAPDDDEDKATKNFFRYSHHQLLVNRYLRKNSNQKSLKY